MSYLHEISTHVLVILFGIGSWITLNGVFVESPLLTQMLPEGWKFSMYINVISQCANIGPVLFSTIQRFVSNKPHFAIWTIHFVMLIGLLSSLLTIFEWHISVYWLNSQHSLPFFILFFFMSLVGCTAVVTFPLFIATFKKQYVTSLVLGESLSGLLPSIVALIQGIEDTQCIYSNTTILDTNTTISKPIVLVKEPKFSVSSFFIFTFIMLGISELSFIILNFWHIAQLEREASNLIKHEVDQNEITPLISEGHRKCTFNKRNIFCLLAIQGWVAALSNTALPSIQSYSAIPYSIFIYHLCATLSNMLSPLGTCMAFFVKIARTQTVILLCSFTTIIASYIFAMAVLSPNPILQSKTAGGVLMVTLWIIFSFTSSFIKVTIANMFRYQGKTSHLGWWGMATQIGSAFGAIIVFILVYVAEIFKASEPCS